MDTLLRVGTAGRLIDFGVATTNAERAAVLAQRFRVYQRRGYCRPGLKRDRDEYDRRAVYVLATMGDGEQLGRVVGSARVILGEDDRSFVFPAEKALRFDLPEAIRKIPLPQRAEVSRLVTERPEGIVVGGLLTPLGLIQAIATFCLQRGIRCGLAAMKLRLLRTLHGVGVQIHELEHTGVTYPRDGALYGYFRHSDPVVPVYWLADNIVPSVVQAIARYQSPTAEAECGGTAGNQAVESWSADRSVGRGGAQTHPRGRRRRERG